MQELLEEALATLVPSDAEQAAVTALCDSLLARARKAAPDGVEPLLVGSVAKGTWLPGADIDLFLRFPEGTDLKAEGLALARAVAPDGRVASFEPRPAHRQVLERNLQRSPHAALVEVIPESLTPETEPRECHAVALDLPQPWELVGWAAASLAPGGRLVAYLPTTPQVAQLLRALEGWGELRVLENLQRDWEPKPQSLRPQHRMLGHTGFIVSARHFG